MKGLELSKRFYEDFGKPMLETQFAEYISYIAVGLMGSGSECYGFDDNISHDHDFEPAFCIFIPNENIIDSKTAFKLEHAYEKLPRQYLGFNRNTYAAVGGNRHGVIRIEDFFEAKVGSKDGQLSVKEWLTIPEFSFCEAVNGEVFSDNYGKLTEIRNRLSYYPKDIHLKKLAGNLLIMGQSGQYNYARCISRNETAAAQLAIIEFVKSATNVIFLLNKKYMPYYKWQFFALKQLPLLSDTAPALEYLISSSNTKQNFEKKIKIIEDICVKIANELKNQDILDKPTVEMEQQAYVVNNNISDGQIRNLHILSGV